MLGLRCQSNYMVVCIPVNAERQLFHSNFPEKSELGVACPIPIIRWVAQALANCY